MEVGLYPGKQALSSPNSETGVCAESSSAFINDRIAGRKNGDHFAQHTLTIGETRGVTLDLSNLSSVYLPREERFLRGEAYLPSHL